MGREAACPSPPAAEATRLGGWGARGLLPLVLLGSLAAGLPPADAGLTTRVSVASTGAQVDGGTGSSLSADGRFVAFDSWSTDLVPGDTNGANDIFVHDRDADADGVFDEPDARATRRVSVTSTGAQANGGTGYASLSADGRFVAFDSWSTDLVPGDTNGADDIFVHDRDADGDGVFDEPGAIATRRVSVSRTGAQANGYSSLPSLSADGRFVAFSSFATNLVPGDTNDTGDIFVHDRDADGDGVFDEPGARATVRVSVSRTGAQGNALSELLSLSADGRFVAFSSFATNLVPGDTNGIFDVFVHDRDADGDGVFDEPGAIATRRVSVSRTGAQANGSSIGPSLSADGRFVAFASGATNLVPGDTNGIFDVFVHDRDADGDGVFDEPGAIATRRVSVSRTGAQANGSSTGSSLSADGRFVAFESGATNLVPGDTNGAEDIFVHDRDADGDGVFDEPDAIATRRVSVRSTGVEGDNSSLFPHLSANGRFVAFSSEATTLVYGDTNRARDVFVHDRRGRTGLTCQNFVVTLRGTPGPDVLVGTPGPDVIWGGGGPDYLEGRAGDDLLCGGDGDDHLIGGNDNDWLVGGAGNDALEGRKGDDRLEGGLGHDMLGGGSGDNTLDGGLGHDRCRIKASAGSDRVSNCETVVPVP